MTQKKFTPPTAIGARFRPPKAVFGRTAGQIEGVITRRLDSLHTRFRGRSR